MTEITNHLGTIRINKFSRQHCKHSHHGNPEKNLQLIAALAEESFQVAQILDSKWGERATQNFVLLVKATGHIWTVVLKQMNGFLMLVTAYEPKPEQVRKLSADICFSI
jgi:hypothetical protein